ncbi:AbrB/MazE/SpoVT family DNA-binding domain-containing protein [Tissierella sp. Yu-01]|uniref:AbrB/MazE/SpoVT family DNA-binding domain-containing protein n=1 Tax=Tissierella sp. Yu-01 TaxID=3035694 RepID=UPI00240E09F2|nr:AbrB/MazE/SpoVT family DNA-binding domain-containing protein [Tissierella sp. Yu-01]WFA08219.1 AbrB/MazE/SpoVT family DNA-binding domain-containing protein [Tissierella sp. Yu-01]
MFTTIQKWGNSQAVRIPKAILEMANLRENDNVELRVHEGNLLIIPVKKHKSLEQRIAEYEGEYHCSEWETSDPIGKEVL